MPRTSALAVASRILLVPYAVALGLIVWLPAASASRVTGLAFRIAQLFSDYTGVSISTSYTVFEFLANVALFGPLGLLLVVGWRRTNMWWIVLLGFAASAAIELVQTVLPSRYPTLSDVVANTLGTMIGCLVARLFVPRIPSRQRS